MGIIAKAAPILSEENLIDIIPVAWELIMETDQELAASAGNIQLCRSDSFIYEYVVCPAENVFTDFHDPVCNIVEISMNIYMYVAKKIVFMKLNVLFYKCTFSELQFYDF